MKKQKVMFFFYRFGGGGAARTLLNIINHLDRDKYEPILVTLNFTYNYESYLKDDVTFIKLDVKKLRQSIVPLAKLLRKERPDILFSTVATYNIIALLASILSFTKTKVIVREAAYLKGNWKKELQLKLYGQLYKRAQKVVALSNGVKENLMNRYKVKEAKIEVIYNPVDINHIQQQMYLPDAITEKDLFSKTEKNILTAGRLVRDKDHLSLIRAFAQVNETVSSRLIIIGEGELLGPLQEEAARLGIAHKVFFPGFKQNPYAYFHQADLFVLTSLNEGFGHVLVEAMVAETPVVSTKAKPGAAEVLANGIYGKLCEVGDVESIAQQIETVLTLSEEDKEAMIAKGMERAYHFEASQIVQQYEQLFQQVTHN